MILPTGTAVHLEEISRICQVIAFAVEHGAEISAALASSARSAA